MSLCELYPELGARNEAGTEPGETDRLTPSPRAGNFTCQSFRAIITTTEDNDIPLTGKAPAFHKITDSATHQKNVQPQPHRDRGYLIMQRL